MIKQNKEGKQEKCSKAILQSRRVCKKKDLIFSDDHSHLSKHLAFLSLQIHHINQCGKSLHKSILRCHLNLPCQDSNNSITLRGITHWSPNKHNTKDYSSYAIGQWRRWSTDSPTPLTHVTPIKNNNMPFAKVISCKNLT